VDKRRSLTPNTGIPNVKTRRGGARLTASDRVTFRGLGDAAGALRAGWALNVSRGGIRAILDDDTGKVELGEEYTICVGDAEPAAGTPWKKGKIVWLQEEPDGFVVGVQYTSPSGRLVAVESGAAPAKTQPPKKK